MKKHDLYDYFHQVYTEIQSEYKLIQTRSKEDPGTAGDQGEENWKKIFEEWLPSTFKIVTKGRILSESNEASPQVDLLILHPDYPNKLLGKKYYLAGGVLAAFECKITLRQKDIKKAIENSVAIRRLIPERKGSIYRELNSGLIYGVLAHSFENTTQQDNKNYFSDKLFEYNNQILRHPRELLDFLCISNLATWETTRTTIIQSQPVSLSPASDRVKLIPAFGTISAYLRYNPTPESSGEFFPVAALITRLYKRIAWEYSNIRNIANYFSSINLISGGGGQQKNWEIEFSDSVVKYIQSLIDQNIILQAGKI